MGGMLRIGLPHYRRPCALQSALPSPVRRPVVSRQSDEGAVEPLERNAGDDVESWRWRVRADGRGAFLVQKAHLPIYRIAVDGKERAPLAANMHRMAVLLEAGEHTVRLWVDRRPFRFSVAVAAAAFLGLLIYGWLGRGDSLR